jgi:hypothetical protein
MTFQEATLDQLRTARHNLSGSLWSTFTTYVTQMRCAVHDEVRVSSSDISQLLVREQLIGQQSLLEDLLSDFQAKLEYEIKLKESTNAN